MLALLAFLFFSVSSKQCPKWTCSKYVPDHLCYKLDKKNNYVHVQDSNTEGCAIEPFLRDPEKYEESNYTMLDSTKPLTYQVFYEQYCKDIDFFKGFFDCDKFMYPTQNTTDYS